MLTGGQDEGDDAEVLVDAEGAEANWAANVVTSADKEASRGASRR